MSTSDKHDVAFVKNAASVLGKSEAELEADAAAQGMSVEQYLRQPIKDKSELLPAFLKTRGLVRQHIESFNYFINHEMRKIVLAKSNRKVTCDHDANFKLEYTNVYVGRPVQEDDSYTRKVFSPQECRLRDMTYSAPISVDVRYTSGGNVYVKNNGEKTGEGSVQIGRLPLMLRSDRCVLNECENDPNGSEAGHAKKGECPLDPGGYFVVKGAEKVILIQEQLSKNRIIVDLDAQGNVTASVTSSTHERKSKTTVVVKQGKFFLRHNAFVEDINVCIAMLALGAESKQEVFQLIGGPENLVSQITPTVLACEDEGVHTQAAALDWMSKRIKGTSGTKQPREKSGKGGRTIQDETRDILASVILCHVPVEDFDYSDKLVYLAAMVSRMLVARKDPRFIDDRDYYGNKRLELAGGLLALLFEDLFKRMNAELKRQADAHMSKTSAKQSHFDITKCIRTDTLTFGLEHAISSGNWSIKRFRMERKGVTQVLSRLSFISAVGMMTRITSQFEKTRKVSGPRALQPSQWGMLCPADTPEGESCGLVKNLALMAHVTTDGAEEPIVALCHACGVHPPRAVSGQERHGTGTGISMVFLNGSLLGSTHDPAHLMRILRKARRARRIGDFTSVSSQFPTVQISSDGGRVCRPLIICDNGVPRVKARHIDLVKSGEWTFDDFLSNGLVEYLDVNEENDMLVALYEKDCISDTTHLEIEPFTILGVVAGLIPYPHHNQSPRNTYQCAMGKQAMGSVAFNQLNRMDTLLYLLVSPQKPLLSTKTIELIRFDELGAGQNATVAVMSYSGFDIEDAIVMNKASLDKGFGRCVVLRKFATNFKRYANRTHDVWIGPTPEELRSKAFSKKFAALDKDGFASPGEKLDQGLCLVNKKVPRNTRDNNTSWASSTGPSNDEFKPAPVSWRGYQGEQCAVDRVMLTANDEHWAVSKVLVRHTRRPELGDKFSSRHGQKGVVGLIVNQADMPFSEKGIVPDLIMNPHGFPSRMTVGKMIELIGSKAAVETGKVHYGTAFGETTGQAHTVEEISKELIEAGYHYSGKDFLCSGITGEPLEAYIFMGPVYYQKLKHMVLDKMHARSRGPRVVLTRQPTEGRSRDGGLRLGEMERDCLIGYGSSMLLLERLMVSSDEFDVFVCRHCGLMGHFDAEKNIPICPSLKKPDHMEKMKLPYAAKLLFQELISMNIVPKMSLAQA